MRLGNRATSAIVGSLMGVLLLTSATRANSIYFTLTSNVGGVYTYKVELDQSSTVKVQAPPLSTFTSFGVVNDFAGLVAGTLNFASAGGLAPPSTDWEVLTHNTMSAFGQATPDDPGIANIVLRYKGAQPFTASQRMTLGTLTAQSSFTSTKLGYYEAQDFDARNSIAGNNGRVLVPTAIPLPAAAWGGLGLLIVLGASRLKGRFV